MADLYSVLVRPLVTEKSNTQSSKLGHYVFVVRSDATRTVVKDALETLFEVTVARVNIVNAPAKRGRRGRSRRMVIGNKLELSVSCYDKKHNPAT